jgi:sugar O-acyltransferase (sialic acid O-acetyltransferase NeuD family)
MAKKTRKVVVFGNSDFATQVTSYFKRDSDYEIVAYTVDAAYNKSKEFLGLPVIDFEVVQEQYPPKEYGMFIAIGYHKLNKTRENKFIEAKSKGYELVSYVCSHNITWDELEIGENCFVMEGNIFNGSVKLSNNVIICVGNAIGHNVIIKDNCYLTSGINIGGFCKIKRNAFIGLGSIVRDKTVIEENNILGAGSIILKNTEKDSSYLTASTPKTKGPNSFIMNLI